MKVKNDVREMIMKLKPEDQPTIHKDHRLKTRRDFLSQGFIASAAFTLGPSLLTLLKTDLAMAADGCIVESNSAVKIPVLTLDLAGGANICGNNFIVGGSAGQHEYLDSYAVMGLPDELNPKNNNANVNSTFGIKMHANSGILEGMLAETAGNPALRSRVDGVVYCAQSENDRSTNPLNAVYWYAKAGAVGELAATIGSQGSTSGGNSEAPSGSLDPTLSPVQINRPRDLTGLINMGELQAVFNNIGSDGIVKAQKTLKAIENQAAHKIATFSNKTLSEQLKQVAECGFDTSRYTEGSLTTQGVDPTQDANINAIYGDNNASTEASIVKAVVGGLVGVGTLQMGNYDYHGDSKLTQDNKDFRVGQVIGRALSYASAVETDLLINIITDGGVSAGNQLQAGRNGVMKFRFQGDNSARAGAVTLVYRHNGSEILRNGSGNTAKRQIGHFNNNTNPSVDTDSGSFIASTTQNVAGNLAAVMTANYLAINGEESRFLDVVGDSYQGISDDLENYIAFRAPGTGTIVSDS